MTDRRALARFAVDQRVRVTILHGSSDPGPRATELTARIADASERGMRLMLEHPLPIDAAIRIDLDDALMLGEVRYSVPMDSGYCAGVELQHCLRNLAELLKIREGFIGTAAPAAPQCVRDKLGRNAE